MAGCSRRFGRLTGGRFGVPGRECERLTDRKQGAQATRQNIRLTMDNERFVKLIDEMVDLRVQQHTAAGLKVNPALAKILAEKRETDRHRLEQVRAELVQMLNE